MESQRRLGTTVAHRFVAGITLAVCLAGGHPVASAQAGRDHWVGTWATALIAPPQTAGSGTPTAGPPPAAPVSFKNQTLRQVIRTSIGGERVRVVVSNAFGTDALVIGAVGIALRDKGAAIVAKSNRPLTFSGIASATIPPGAILVSDPVNLVVPPLADLAIDVHLPGDTAATESPLTTHAAAHQTNYISPPGNHVGAGDMPGAATTTSWFFLARVEVIAPEQVGAIVAFGDSITDGSRSSDDANRRWPDVPAKRLAAQTIRMGVLNAGIGANRVLSEGTGANALARFDRDALVATGATHLIVLEGINDLRNQAPAPSAAELIAGYRQLIVRAHARGLRVYGGTLLPCEGAARWTPEVEKKRQEINDWIRTSKMYDGVVDFDAATRDPKEPSKLLPKYDSGDHLHPSDAGYQAMAEAIDLGLFAARQQRATASNR